MVKSHVVYSLSAMLTFAVCQVTMILRHKWFEESNVEQHEVAVVQLKEQFAHQKKLYHEIFADELEWNRKHYEEQMEKQRNEIRQLMSEENGNVHKVAEDLDAARKRREQLLDQKSSAQNKVADASKTQKQLVELAQTHIGEMQDELSICQTEVDRMHTEYSRLRVASV